eukprot:TRINITY_DN8503_c0_g3_i1.p1 TRINITY_DN8503_c0_g3~~TRINITY_DN8503_c0_g3_i1.p1  ORF type:complete len:265 (-),score=38.71 TRINITY_DN8503_c0_g3_i1:380-1174(-)
MFDSGCFCNQRSSDLRRRELEDVVAVSSTTGSKMWLDRNLGNDFCDSPRDFLFDKLDVIHGQQKEMSSPHNSNFDVGDAERFAHKGGKVYDARDVSDVVPFKVRNRTRLRRQRRVGTADAARTASQILEMLDTIDMRAQGGSAFPAPVATTRPPAANVEGGKEGRREREQSRPLSKTAKAVMLRNLPDRCSAEELLAEIKEEGLGGQIDFFYMPTDSLTTRKDAFAFIQFKTSSDTNKFVFGFNGRRLTRYETQGVLQVTPVDT